ncbi:MAG: hypothetical protein LBF08_02535 [Dysgonamonadaceae bacterium]|jgi:hypothetical protein|nr:hypothetical protein [Dysgonamonadaceae bacterium]
MEEDFFDQYDDSEVVAFILNYLPMELKGKFTEDDIYYILDTSEDYYAQNNFFETEDEDAIEERKLIEYIIREAEKDKVGKFTEEDILFVLRGEETYLDSIFGDIK